MSRMPHTALQSPWSRQFDRTYRLTLVSCSLLAAAFVGALMAPLWFWLPPVMAAAAGIAVLAFRHTVVFCVAWLLIAGATLEMTLHPLRDRPGLSQTIPERPTFQWLNTERSP